MKITVDARHVTNTTSLYNHAALALGPKFKPETNAMIDDPKSPGELNMNTEHIPIVYPNLCGDAVLMRTSHEHAICGSITAYKIIGRQGRI